MHLYSIQRCDHRPYRPVLAVPSIDNDSSGDTRHQSIDLRYHELLRDLGQWCPAFLPGRPDWQCLVQWWAGSSQCSQSSTRVGTANTIWPRGVGWGAHQPQCGPTGERSSTQPHGEGVAQPHQGRGHSSALPTMQGLDIWQGSVATAPPLPNYLTPGEP